MAVDVDVATCDDDEPETDDEEEADE